MADRSLSLSVAVILLWAGCLLCLMALLGVRRRGAVYQVKLTDYMFQLSKEGDNWKDLQELQVKKGDTIVFNQTKDHWVGWASLKPKVDPIRDVDVLKEKRGAKSVTLNIDRSLIDKTNSSKANGKITLIGYCPKHISISRLRQAIETGGKPIESGMWFTLIVEP